LSYETETAYFPSGVIATAFGIPEGREMATYESSSDILTHSQKSL